MPLAFEGWSGRLPPAVCYRLANEADRRLPCALYASTREDKMRLVDRPEAQTNAFPGMLIAIAHIPWVIMAAHNAPVA